VRQLIRRLCACDSGAGTVEYALLIAFLALGLIGVLSLFRNTIGSALDRTAVTVSKTAGGYGVRGTIGGGSGGGAIAHGPTTGDPDNPTPDPDSSAASGGTAVASSRPVKP
jgi:Flp pilus assembly pilin Flp